MKTRIFAAVFLSSFCVPFFAHALVRVSEIMYDVEGTDTGREWIEVVNEGSTAIDLSSFKLFEANTNHGLTLVLGNAVVPAGGYAVIADNPEKFKADWPSWSGALFDSAFSLSNTGETIAIKNGNLIEEDTATYSSELGAAGDGHSLHRSGTAFIAAAPSPGQGPSAQEAAPAETNTASASYGASVPENPSITAYAGKDRTVIVGADALFEAQSFGTDGLPLLNAKYVWSFGNGRTAQGKSVFHHYEYPGTYVVMLTVSSGDYSASARFVATAYPAQLTVQSETDGSISVFNESSSEIDIGRWILRKGTSSFVLPPQTVILARQGLRFSPTLTKLPPGGAVDLLYPNGSFAVTESEISGTALIDRGLIEKVSAPRQPVARAVLGTETEEVDTVQQAIVRNDPYQPSSELVAEKEEPLWPWLVSLLLLIGSGAFGVWYIRRVPQSLADQFEIIDISEKN